MPEGLAEPLGYLRCASVLVIPVHLFEQVIVKALDADREPVDARPLEDLQTILGQVVRIGFDRQFPDVKRGARQSNRLLQFVDQDRRRSTPDIDRAEVISEIAVENDFLTKRSKIAAAEIFHKGDTIKRAIRAELFAERDMDIEKPGPLFARGGHIGRPSVSETHRLGEFASRFPGNE